MEEDKLMHVRGGDLPDKKEEIFSTDSNGGVMVIEKNVLLSFWVRVAA
jgi:hypothetical protein